MSVQSNTKTHWDYIPTLKTTDSYFHGNWILFFRLNVSCRKILSSFVGSRVFPGWFNSFWPRPQSGIHIYERQQSKKGGEGAGPQIFARGTRNPRFNPLSTCWHVGIRPFLSAILSRCQKNPPLLFPVHCHRHNPSAFEPPLNISNFAIIEDEASSSINAFSDRASPLVIPFLDRIPIYDTDNLFREP